MKTIEQTSDLAIKKKPDLSEKQNPVNTIYQVIFVSEPSPEKPKDPEPRKTPKSALLLIAGACMILAEGVVMFTEKALKEDLPIQLILLFAGFGSAIIGGMYLARKEGAEW